MKRCIAIPILLAACAAACIWLVYHTTLGDLPTIEAFGAPF